MIVLHAAFHNNQLLLWSEPESAAGAGPRVQARAWLPAPKAHVVAPHEILARSLQGSEAVDFLASCLGKSLLEPGVLIGADLAYWAAAMKFAAGLAIRGQYLPGLTRGDGNYEARWKPVIAGPDAARLDAVAKAMPPAARALTFAEAEEPPQTQRILCCWISRASPSMPSSEAPGPGESSATKVSTTGGKTPSPRTTR